MNTATAENKIMYTVNAQNFSKIPGSPIAYWASKAMFRCFEEREPLENHFFMREGIHTANNELFLRFWHEINVKKFVLTAASYSDIDNLGKWVPYNKGGLYRKWYGNNDYVIAFDYKSRNAMAMLQGHVRPSQSLYFVEGGTWTAVSSGRFGIRYYPNGFLFDAGGQVAIGNDILGCIAYLNSKLFSKIAEITMPTMNFKCGVIKTMPDLRVDFYNVKDITEENIAISKTDWDAFETSWDFKKHPLV